MKIEEEIKTKKRGVWQQTSHPAVPTRQTMKRLPKKRDRQAGRILISAELPDLQQVKSITIRSRITYPTINSIRT